MIIVRFFMNCFFKTAVTSVIGICMICFWILSVNGASLSTKHELQDSGDVPLTTDSRIRTYIYTPNNVYLMILHYGFQSHIEFAKDEEVQTISLGDSYAWKITPVENRLFIKPMEKNIRTNMTVITNKRTYQFDLISQVLEDENDDVDLVYVIRFIYPKKQNHGR